MIHLTFTMFLLGHILRTEETGKTIQNGNFDEMDIREVI